MHNILLIFLNNRSVDISSVSMGLLTYIHIWKSHQDTNDECSMKYIRKHTPKKRSMLKSIFEKTNKAVFHTVIFRIKWCQEDVII